LVNFSNKRRKLISKRKLGLLNTDLKLYFPQYHLFISVFGKKTFFSTKPCFFAGFPKKKANESQKEKDYLEK